MFYNQFRMVIVQQFWIFSQMSDWEFTDDETPVKQDLNLKKNKKSPLDLSECSRQLAEVESRCHPCDTWLFARRDAIRTPQGH